MAAGARVTDEVEYYRRHGDLKQAIRVVRDRTAERLRWRTAVASVTKSAAVMDGIHRMRVEEPIREIVLDLEDAILRRESVLDARRVGVDLDRGEVLRSHNRWDLKRTAFLTGVDHDLLGRYMQLPSDYNHGIDTAAAVVLSRSIATAYQQRGDGWLGRLYPGLDGIQVQTLKERARSERKQAQGWAALAHTLVKGSR